MTSFLQKHAIMWLVLLAFLFIGASSQGDAPVQAACNQELYDLATKQGDDWLVQGESVRWSATDGTISTYLKLGDPATACDAPVAVGYEMSSVDFFDLPAPEEVSIQRPECADDYFAPGCDPPTEIFYLNFPGKDVNASYTPFTFLELNYQPLGHAPAGVFNVPHFDSHFWLTPQSDIEAIAAGQPGKDCSGLTPEAFARAHQPVPEECFPEGYINANAVVPKEGNHLIYTQEPVVRAASQGTPDNSLWTEPSWIYGMFDGRIVFFEPMITQNIYQKVQQDGTRECFEIPVVPSAFPEASNYPTRYCLDGTEPGVVRLELTDFKPLPAGCEGDNYATASYINNQPPPPGTPPLPEFCQPPML